MRVSQHPKHDDIEIENVPQTVQIIDPKHPLFSNTYAVLSLETPYGRNWLAVEMPCGYVRVIPCEATDLNCETLKIEALQQLPRISVPLMLHLQELLQRQMHKKEDEDGENGQETGGIAREANDLAAIDAITAGANSGGCAADIASMANQGAASEEGGK